MTHSDSVPLSVSVRDVDLSSEPPSLPSNIEVFFREQIKRKVSDADESDRAARARRAIHIVTQFKMLVGNNCECPLYLNAIH